MTYRELLARLYATRRFGVRFEIERVSRLLDRLDRPERAFRRIARIGGTNGKGSTVAFAEALVRRGGARTGAFTSPHLSRLAERFRVDGEPVDDAEVQRAGEAVFAAVDASDETITFFEQVAAMALVVFARAGVEVAILEVGMGGRLDATNAVSADVSAVTGVALDHQQFLGDTLAEIAREKAGIFETGKVAVIGGAGEAAGEGVLVEQARRAGAEVVIAPDGVSEHWKLGLAGGFQRANAACAVAVAQRLVSLDEAAIREALAATRCPGRFDRVALDPVTIVDGAHNPHAARAIAAEVDPDTCVIAVGAGKDAAGVVGPLIAGARRVFATEAPPADRLLAAAEVGKVCRRVSPTAEVRVEPDPGRAIDQARAGARGPVLIAGSLFLAGAARRHLCADPSDPVFLADPGNLPTL